MRYLARLVIILCCIACQSRGQVLIILENIPQNTPKEANIYFASSLNGWQPKDENYCFELIDEQYRLSLNTESFPVEYKITLGSWQKVEVNKEQQDITNRRIDGKQKEVLINVEAWKDESQAKPRLSTTSDNVRRLEHVFHIKALNRKRQVWLYLPPDYETSGKSYPVLYLQDGQNIFDQSTAFAEEWGVDELLNEHFAKTEQGFIVVAVEAGKFRLQEYQPWTHPRSGEGKGSEYVEFLINEVKPFIDKHYRTIPDAQNTAIIGSSMGGLISFYASMKHPEIFGKAGVFSPAFWIAEDYLKSFIDKQSSQTSPKMYFLTGLSEDPLIWRVTREIHTYLRNQGFSGLPLIEREKGKHTESFWREEFLEGIKYLFPLEKNKDY